MLKGALTPDNGAYTIEIQYQKDEDEDYILVERVTDSLRIMIIDGSASPNSQLGRELAASPRIPMEGKGDADTPMSDADGQARCAHLPTVTVPKLLQTPQNIPPLYPFSRTTVYILMSLMVLQSQSSQKEILGTIPSKWKFQWRSLISLARRSNIWQQRKQ